MYSSRVEKGANHQITIAHKVVVYRVFVCVFPKKLISISYKSSYQTSRADNPEHVECWALGFLRTRLRSPWVAKSGPHPHYLHIGSEASLFLQICDKFLTAAIQRV